MNNENSKHLVFILDYLNFIESNLDNKSKSILLFSDITLLQKQFLFHYTNLIDYCIRIDFDVTVSNLNEDFSDGNEKTNNYFIVKNNKIIISNCLSEVDAYNFLFSVLDLSKHLNQFNNFNLTIDIIELTIERLYNKLYNHINKDYKNEFEIYQSEFENFQKHFELKNKQFD